MGNRACCAGESSAQVFDMVKADQMPGPCRGIVEDTHSLAVAFGAAEDPEEHWRRSLAAVESPEVLPGQALVEAVRSDDGTAVLMLVAEGTEFCDMRRALRLAAFGGRCTVVRELAAIGLNVNEECPFTGFTALQLAAAGGHVGACELLLDAMANVHQCARGSWSALAIAHRMGNSEVVLALEQHQQQLAMQEENDNNAAHMSSLHVLPRVSQSLSESVLRNARPAEGGSAPGVRALKAPGPPSGSVAAAALGNGGDDADGGDAAQGERGPGEPGENDGDPARRLSDFRNLGSGGLARKAAGAKPTMDGAPAGAHAASRGLQRGAGPSDVGGESGAALWGGLQPEPCEQVAL